MKKKGIGAVIFGIVFGLVSSIASVVFFFHYFADVEPEKSLIPASEEGVCLTDDVNGENLSITNISTYFKDACVSIILTNGSYVAWGSGVCVASKGYEYATDKTLSSGSYIVTNHHVIESYLEAKQTIDPTDDYIITVYPNNYQNEDSTYTTYEAELLWWDSYMDMAIIHVKEDIDWVRIKDRSIKSKNLSVYEKLFCIGSPYVESKGVLSDPITKVDFNKVTTGNAISFIDGGLYTAEDEPYSYRVSNIYENMIETNIEIHPGNSGGGLFDRDGYLIGQPTLSGEGIYYSNAIYPYTLILNGLISDKESLVEYVGYNLDGLPFRVIDSYESEVIVQDSFREKSGIFFPTLAANNKYLYGKIYSNSQLSFSSTGVKVIYSDDVKFSEGDVITSVTVGEKTTTITKRQDLIYVLIQLKQGDEVYFNFAGSKEAVSLICE